MRVKKTSNGNTTLYGWDNDRIYAEYDASGNAIQETVYFGSTPIALLKDNSVYRIFSDQIDTLRVIANQDNDALWPWESKPFGETLPNEDADGDGDGLSLSYNLRFPGQYFDQETEKHYNFNRDYNPATGRYIQSDPIGLDGGMNTFGYSGGSPIAAIDPTGHKYTKTITSYNIQINATITLFHHKDDVHTHQPLTSAQGWALAHRWRAGIMNNWHANGSRRYGGTRLTSLIGKSVTFNVRVIYDPNATAFWNASVVGSLAEHNAVRIGDTGGRAFVNGLNGWTGEYPRDATGWVAAHEFGHHIGLDDNYNDAGGPCNGASGHMMGSYNGVLQQYELDNMIDLNPMGCN